MKDMVEKKFGLFFLVIVIVCCFYLLGKATYTSYESFIEGRMSNQVAGIHLLINGFDVVESGGELDNNVILENTTWESTHTREGKISPGSSGTIALELDATGSEVAILYEFQFVDKLIDNDKLLNFGDITCNGTLIRTSRDTYTGIISLADIQASRKVNIDVDFYFDYLNDIEGITEDNQILDDLFEIHFHALQYNGETITPYVGN